MAIEPEGLQKNIPVMNNLKIEELLLNPSESSIKPEKALHDCASHLASELSTELIDKLAMIAIATASNDYKAKIIVEFLVTIPKEKFGKFMSICLNKTIDEAIPEIMALLSMQSTTEIDGPTK